MQAEEEKQGEGLGRGRRRGVREAGGVWGAAGAGGAGVPAEGSIAPAQPGGRPARLLAPCFSSPKQCVRWARFVTLRQRF